jgi:hypothetical protein
LTALPLADSGILQQTSGVQPCGPTPLACIIHALVAGVIDSQSVKTTERGGPRGYDAGKKIKGRKRTQLESIRVALLAIADATGDVDTYNAD